MGSDPLLSALDSQSVRRRPVLAQAPIEPRCSDGGTNAAGAMLAAGPPLFGCHHGATAANRANRDHL